MLLMILTLHLHFLLFLDYSEDQRMNEGYGIYEDPEYYNPKDYDPDYYNYEPKHKSPTEYINYGYSSRNRVDMSRFRHRYYNKPIMNQNRKVRIIFFHLVSKSIGKEVCKLKECWCLP